MLCYRARSDQTDGYWPLFPPFPTHGSSLSIPTSFRKLETLFHSKTCGRGETIKDESRCCGNAEGNEKVVGFGTLLSKITIKVGETKREIEGEGRRIIHARARFLDDPPSSGPVTYSIFRRVGFLKADGFGKSKDLIWNGSGTWLLVHSKFLQHFMENMDMAPNASGIDNKLRQIFFYRL